jgi:hypothetical protein
MAAGRLMMDPRQPGWFLVTLSAAGRYTAGPSSMSPGSEFSDLYNCTQVIELDDVMKAYTHSEARENFASVLEEATFASMSEIGQ